MHSTRQAHDRCCPESFPFNTIRFVFREVPGIRGLTSFIVQRQARVVALGGRDHTPAPVFRDNGDPITGQIEWSLLAPGWRRTGRSATFSLLGEYGERNGCQD